MACETGEDLGLEPDGFVSPWVLAVLMVPPCDSSRTQVTAPVRDREAADSFSKTPFSFWTHVSSIPKPWDWNNPFAYMDFGGLSRY